MNLRFLSDKYSLKTKGQVKMAQFIIWPKQNLDLGDKMGNNKHVR